jgi:hypothetical protein
MSLIVAITDWARKTLKSWITIFISTVVLACVFWIMLPRYFGGRNTVPVTPVQSTPEMLSDEISKHINDTKLRLIFRTHADLADRLGIPQQDIILNEVKPKTWTDTGLECPTPDFGSPLVEVPQRTKLQGWIITWKLGTDVYEYNTSVKGDWVLCSKIEIPEGIAQYRSPANK